MRFMGRPERMGKAIVISAAEAEAEVMVVVAAVVAVSVTAVVVLARAAAALVAVADAAAKASRELWRNECRGNDYRHQSRRRGGDGDDGAKRRFHDAAPSWNASSRLRWK